MSQLYLQLVRAEVYLEEGNLAECQKLILQQEKNVNSLDEVDQKIFVKLFFVKARYNWRNNNFF